MWELEHKSNIIDSMWPDENITYHLANHGNYSTFELLKENSFVPVKTDTSSTLQYKMNVAQRGCGVSINIQNATAH